jgi:hypothetical protein
MLNLLMDAFIEIIANAEYKDYDVEYKEDSYADFVYKVKSSCIVNLCYDSY